MSYYRQAPGERGVETGPRSRPSEGLARYVRPRPTGNVLHHDATGEPRKTVLRKVRAPVTDARRSIRDRVTRDSRTRDSRKSILDKSPEPEPEVQATRVTRDHRGQPPPPPPEPDDGLPETEEDLYDGSQDDDLYPPPEEDAWDSGGGSAPPPAPSPLPEPGPAPEYDLDLIPDPPELEAPPPWWANITGTHVAIAGAGVALLLILSRR